MTQTTQENQPGFRPLPFLLMVIVLVALAGGWWLTTTRPADTTNAANMLTPQSGTQATGETQAQKEVTLFLPNDDAMLEKESASEPANIAADFVSQTKAAFALMQQKSPKDFPKGTVLLDVKKGGDGVAVLNFNTAFTDSNFWQGEAQTSMTIYSIVNTVAALHATDFTAKQVQFNVEGKPIEVLGEFDAHDPIEPDMQWVVKH